MSIRAYYEQNTRLFLALGSDAAAQTIHRAVWGPGVAQKRAALEYVHTRIAATLRAHFGAAAIRVLDIGCGAGGSLKALALQLGAAFDGSGITISPTQARIARDMLTRRGLAEQCRVIEGDFLHMPFRQQFDSAFAIESLIHANEPAEVLREIAAIVRPGGLLIICDDLLTPAGTAAQGAERRYLELFRNGWQAHGLWSAAELCSSAERYGFRVLETCDLTPYLRLVPISGGALRVLAACADRTPAHRHIIRSLAGSAALQTCLARRLIEYRWIVFQL